MRDKPLTPFPHRRGIAGSTPSGTLRVTETGPLASTMKTKRLQSLTAGASSLFLDSGVGLAQTVATWQTLLLCRMIPPVQRGVHESVAERLRRAGGGDRNLGEDHRRRVGGALPAYRRIRVVG